MASAEDFDGDEFSNNLFSDLAPLLTLFGEQVTMQFLSLSMGWADNFLLAMGPLGIITIVVSAIRISGGRRLKSLIGRARETQSVAEQQLLSSTSANVCELWNGEQITRLVGEPKGMETFIISPHGKIHHLDEALAKGMITIKNQNDQDRGDTADGPRIGPRTLEETLEFNVETAPLNLPANLSLNTRSALASPSTLWLLAAFGVALQTAALVFPGVATYYFEWKKGDAPVAGYGYLCFVIGTVSLTIGIILCGHIIEGATEETDYVLSKKLKDEGFRILCLQQALTLGDQDFPSCAIFLGGDAGVLKTSRRGYLKYSSTWSRCTVSVSLTLSGYIVQFVGLRALHWSATIVQLGVTVVMTGIRALARTSLASDPETSTLSLQGHEKAWLNLLIKSGIGKATTPRSVWHSPQQILGYFTKRRADHVDLDRAQFFWEIISDHSEESSAVAYWLDDSNLNASSDTRTSDRTGFVTSQLLQRTKGPFRTSLKFLQRVPNQPALRENSNIVNTVQIYQKIHSGIGLTTTPDIDSERAAMALCTTIERMINPFTEGEIIGRRKGIFKCLKFDDVTQGLLDVTGNLKKRYSFDICWEFNIREGCVSEYDKKETTQETFKIYLRHDYERSLRMPISNGHDWFLDYSAHVQLKAAISLSLYTDAARLAYATGQAQTGTQTASRHTKRQFRRIIGYTERGNAENYKEQLQRWLKCDIMSSTMSSMRKEQVSLQMKGLVQATQTLGSASSVRETRLGLNKTATRQLREDVRPLTQMIRQGVSGSFFGMFLSSVADHPEDSLQGHFVELYIECPSETSMAIRYAQELLSLFILSVASKAKPGIHVDRSLFETFAHESIAATIVENGLVQSKDEAYTLIVPAFFKYQLLPPERNDGEHDSVAEEELKVGSEPAVSE